MSSRHKKPKNPKFWQTEEFKRLKEVWITGKKVKEASKSGQIETRVVASKLMASGFKDIENPNGSLKSKNLRTQGFREQASLIRISSALSAYIQSSSVSLTPLEKTVLELHSEGVYRKHIMRRVNKSHQTVWKIIKSHTALALGLYAKEEENSGEPE